MENTVNAAHTLADLAKVYNVDRRTLYNWIRPIRQELLEMYPSPTAKKYLSFLLPKQIKRITEYLG